jgi:hypothetical protein
LIAGRYIDEVLKEEFFSSAPAGVLEKRVFWDNRIVSDSLPGLSGLADKERRRRCSRRRRRRVSKCAQKRVEREGESGSSPELSTDGM